MSNESNVDASDSIPKENVSSSPTSEAKPQDPSNPAPARDPKPPKPREGSDSPESSDSTSAKGAKDSQQDKGGSRRKGAGEATPVKPPGEQGDDRETKQGRSSSRKRSPRRRGSRGGSKEDRDDRQDSGRGDDSGDNGEESDGKKNRGREDGGPSGGKRQRPPRQRKPPETLEGPPVDVEGIVEISTKGFGFVRVPEKSFAQDPTDAFITPERVRKWNLRHGHKVIGKSLKGQRGPQLAELESINGEQPDYFLDVPAFEELKAINPDKRLLLETTQERNTTRIIDMMAPVGKGQRGLIVAPPRTGKTTLLQHIGEAIVENHPDIHLMALLIDERPEEVTEFRRALPQAEQYASSNDSGVSAHTRTALFAIERARRLVEMGQDVVILLDSITRLARSFNMAMRGGGKMGSGGLDTRALEMPRKIFASARNVRDGGSLTILGTALVETGSKMDEAIFLEFKGTGNMELVLDRKIAEHYIYPAVDIFRSGTRREELILPPHQLHKIHVIRRGLAGHKPTEAIERLLSFCDRFPNNAQMLIEIPG